MSKRTLAADITGLGIAQGDLVLYLNNVQDLINELQDDHDTSLASLEALLTKMDSDPGCSNTNYSALLGTGGSGTALPADLTNTTNLVLTGG
jgi:hypothetical protein